MTLKRHPIILGRVKVHSIVLMVSTSIASAAWLNISPLVEGLLEENEGEISSYFFGL